MWLIGRDGNWGLADRGEGSDFAVGGGEGVFEPGYFCPGLAKLRGQGEDDGGVLVGHDRSGNRTVPFPEPRDPVPQSRGLSTGSRR